MSDDTRELAVIFVLVCLVIGLVMVLLAGYSKESDECERRGGVVIVDKFYRSVCVGSPGK